MPITCTIVDVNADCIGNRWEVTNEDQLATLVGIVAKCEFGHAQSILAGVVSHNPIYSAQQEIEIRQEVIESLTLKKGTDGKEVRDTKKWHRDGFLFEAISWIVARQSNPENVIMRDPHISATTQGLDGLMIELNATGDDVIKTTVVEDKCVEEPIGTFRYKIVPAFKQYQKEHRKVLESASTLLRGNFPPGLITSIAAKVISPDIRYYRASITIVDTEDTLEERNAIFGFYDQITGLLQENRIACTFLTGTNVRDWFEQFALKVIANL